MPLADTEERDTDDDALAGLDTLPLAVGDAIAALPDGDALVALVLGERDALAGKGESDGVALPVPDGDATVSALRVTVPDKDGGGVCDTEALGDALPLVAPLALRLALAAGD